MEFMPNMPDFNSIIMHLIKINIMNFIAPKKFSILLLFIFSIIFHYQTRGQFGIGVATNYDFYQSFTNPQDNLDQGRSSGSALTSFAIGPKIWIGKPSFSVSLEAQAGIGLLTLDVNKFKGIGSAHFPILASLNFKGVSGLGTELKPGFSIGGGIQYNRTELFGVTTQYKNAGVERSLFPTYIIQAGGGIGFNGFVIHGFVRYGFHPESEAQSLNIGIQTDLNLRAFRKNMNNPNSAL